MLTVRSTINIASQASPPIIQAVQGDTGRVIVFTLADFTIPAGATATYYVQKPSGLAVYNDATIDGNTVIVELTAQSIIEDGDNFGQIRIFLDEEVVTSFDFILLVKPFRGIDATESDVEMNIFDKAVNSAMEQIDGSLNNIVAEEFDAENSYLAGEYVLNEGKFYKFTVNHSGAWSAADVEETTIGDELNNGGGGGGGAVDSVNGKTGNVVLDAGDLEYDNEETYSSGTVGSELSDLKSELSDKIDSPSVAGTSGQVLTSDGNGGQSWQTPQSGGSVSPYTSNPAALGTASPGLSDDYARGDHVHPMPTAANVGAIASPSSPATGAFLVWNGSAWVAQTLSTWQGGSY